MDVLPLCDNVFVLCYLWRSVLFPRRLTGILATAGHLYPGYHCVLCQPATWLNSTTPPPPPPTPGWLHTVNIQTLWYYYWAVVSSVIVAVLLVDSVVLIVSGVIIEVNDVGNVVIRVG